MNEQQPPTTYPRPALPELPAFISGIMIAGAVQTLVFVEEGALGKAAVTLISAILLSAGLALGWKLVGWILNLGTP